MTGRWQRRRSPTRHFGRWMVTAFSSGFLESNVRFYGFDSRSGTMRSDTENEFGLYFSYTKVRCPKCQRLADGPMATPGDRNGRCRDCKTEFTYQIAFVSPRLMDDEPVPTKPKSLQSKSSVDLRSDDSGTDWESAIEQCDSILSQCDDIPERGEMFADSIREKVGSIRDWIEENETVTQAQLQAIENMADGVGRWLGG